jgi:pyruvate-formate lyase
MLASALSVAKIPYAQSQDGISLTNTVVPSGLGRTVESRCATSPVCSTPTWARTDIT